MNEMTKEPIRLRAKQLKNGRQSLYLDIYIDGMRKYEFLHLYLEPELTKADRQKNETTLQLANAIKAKRIVALQNGRFGFDAPTIKGDADIYQYITEHGKKTGRHGKAAMKHAKCLNNKLKEFTGKEVLQMKMIDKSFLLRFIKFLQTTPTRGHLGLCKPKMLSQNSIHTYFTKLVTVLHCAYRDRLIPEDPTNFLQLEERTRKEHVEKVYLTEEELVKLTQAKCNNQYVADIFLFSCLTGLRYSDIITLRWSELEAGPDGTIYLSKVQVKTQNKVGFPLPPSAIKLLPERKADNTLVFGKQFSHATVTNQIKGWCKRAGISKHVTFHSARHTFATLILTKGADLYTVSKLLGHTNIKTTHIYARVVEQSKQKAIDLLSGII